MITYLYKFADDGELFEVRQSIKDEPLTEFGGRPVERVITGGLPGWVNPFDNRYPYVSHRLPRHLEGCRTTFDGKPVVESREHEASIASKLHMHRE